MIKNSGKFCCKLDFAAATLTETLRQAQKREVELEWEAPRSWGVGQCFISCVHLQRTPGKEPPVFTCKGPQARNPLCSPAKDPRQGTPCSGANKTLSSLLTAVLMKISREDCCSRDHQLTYARSANPQKLLEEYQTLLLRVGGVWARDYTSFPKTNPLMIHLMGGGCIAMAI